MVRSCQRTQDSITCPGPTGNATTKMNEMDHLTGTETGGPLRDSRAAGVQASMARGAAGGVQRAGPS